MLVKTTLHPTDLCEQLAKGVFNSYKVIDIRILQAEANAGILTPEEFFEVVIQDLLKQSAKLYIGKNVYAGTWQNAYNQLKENYFRTFTGVVFQKYIIAEMLQEYRWRLGYAHRYCLSHPEFNLLFPSDYFDRTRKTRHEGGFEYTKKAWNKHLKDTEKTKNRKLATKRKAKLREGKIFSAKEVTDKIKQFLKARITIETFYNFVEKNHPSFLPHLSDMTHKIQAQLQKSK